MFIPRLVTGMLATVFSGAVLAAMLKFVVLAKAQPAGAADQGLVNSVVDSLMNCPNKKLPSAAGNFYFEFESPSSSGATHLIRLDSVGFTDRPAYSIRRDGPASLDKNNAGLTLSFHYRVEQPNQIKYNYKVVSNESDAEYTGKVSAVFGDSVSFFQIYINDANGVCKPSVWHDRVERIDECASATTTDVPLFETHKTLKDQIAFWAGNDVAKGVLRILYRRSVIDLKECIEKNEERREKLCKLLSIVPHSVPEKFKTYKFVGEQNN